MQRVDADFKKRVYEIVGQIPKGRIMTYGQIAALASAAWAGWEVGQIAHRGPARGYPGGFEGHKKALLADGVEVDEDFKVDIERLLWHPQAPGQNSLPL